MRLFSKSSTLLNAVHKGRTYSIARECNHDHEHHNCRSFQHSGEISPAFSVIYEIVLSEFMGSPITKASFCLSFGLIVVRTDLQSPNFHNSC